ncbi:MAG: transposase [Desulfovibrio sp.]|nr:transposase [Desulfovibrio sp.]
MVDNLRAHKYVQSCHAEVKFLPAYSPDLNPIEKMWSKVKQIPRGLKPRQTKSCIAPQAQPRAWSPRPMPGAGLNQLDI